MYRKILLRCALAVGLIVPSLARAQQSNISFQVLESFLYPNEQTHLTYDFGVANSGESAGYALHTQGINHQYAQGFTVSRTGKFSEPIIFPGAMNTYLYGVNSSGVACGLADRFSAPGATAFFYDGQNFTPYEVSGALSTYLNCINDKGDFGGHYVDATTLQSHAFVSIGGALTPFDVPGGAYAQVNGINNAGQAVGWYSLPNDDDMHGFFRDADGTLTYPLDYTGTDIKDTLLNGINDHGLIVGYSIDFQITITAFVLQLPNQYTPYQVSGSSVTEFQGINNSDVISGQYTQPEPFEIEGLILKASR